MRRRVGASVRKRVFFLSTSGIPRMVNVDDIRLPGNENSKFDGARPVYLIITTIKWTRTSRLSSKSSLSLG